MNKNNLAILWDLDGTIVDTKACHFYAWRNALNKRGINLDESVFRANFGRNNATLLPLFLGFEPDDDLTAELLNAKETVFQRMAPDQVVLIPGVKSWLSAAAALNLSQAIASSAPIENINLLLDSFNLAEYFKAVISGNDLPTKPGPEIFFKAADSLRCPPGNCLVIEDSLAGVQAAKKAGMKCVAVTTTHARNELGLADLVIDNFSLSFDRAMQTLGLI